MDLYEKEDLIDRESFEESQNAFEFPLSIPEILASKANISDQSSEDNAYYVSVLKDKRVNVSNPPGLKPITVNQSLVRDADESSVTEKPSNDKVKFNK